MNLRAGTIVARCVWLVLLVSALCLGVITVDDLALAQRGDGETESEQVRGGDIPDGYFYDHHGNLRAPKLPVGAFDAEDMPLPSGVVAVDPPESAAVDRAIQRAAGGLDARVRPTDASRNETSIAVNPLDPRNIVGAIHDYSFDGDSSILATASVDNGRTWTNTQIPGINGVQGDPAVAAGTDCTFYVAFIDFNRGDDANAMQVARSRSCGVDWDPAVAVVNHAASGSNDFEDKEYIAVDNSGGPNHGNVYLTWTTFFDAGGTCIRFSSSSDGGQTWSGPVCISDTSGVQGSVPVVGPDGTIMVFWRQFGTPQIMMDRSTDGGSTWGTDISVGNITPVPASINGLNRLNSFPSAAVSMAESNNPGRTTVVWADNRNGDVDIFQDVTDDNGDSFLGALRWNRDPVSNGIDQFFPWTTTDPRGVNHTIWYDRRRDSSNLLIDVFGNSSLNGGSSLSGVQDFLVTDENFTPEDAVFNGNFLGDYNGVASDSRYFYPFWTDTRFNDLEQGMVTVVGSSAILAGIGPTNFPGSFIRDFTGGGRQDVQLVTFGAGNGGSEVSVAKGDVDGDGLVDYVVGQRGTGAASAVRILSGNTNAVVRTFFAFGGGNSSGKVNVGLGDLDRDGDQEIIVGTGPGGPNAVRIFDVGPGFNETLLNTFFPFTGGENPGGEIRVDGGLTLANNDFGQIIVGTGHGGTSRVKVFDFVPMGAPRLVSSFVAFGGVNGSGGLDVAAGNLDQQPTGRDLIIVGQGGPGDDSASAGSAVRVFTERGDLLDTFPAFGPANSKGFVTVSSGEVDADRTDEIIVGSGFGGPTGGFVRVFNFMNPTPIVSFPAFGPGNANNQVDVAGDKKSARCDLTGTWINEFNEEMRLTQSGVLFDGDLRSAGPTASVTHEVEGYVDNRFAHFISEDVPPAGGFATPLFWATVSADCDTLTTRWRNEFGSGVATFTRAGFERRPQRPAGPSPTSGR